MGKGWSFEPWHDSHKSHFGRTTYLNWVPAMGHTMQESQQTLIRIARLTSRRCSTTASLSSWPITGSLSSCPITGSLTSWLVMAFETGYEVGQYDIISSPSCISRISKRATVQPPLSKTRVASLSSSSLDAAWHRHPRLSRKNEVNFTAECGEQVSRCTHKHRERKVILFSWNLGMARYSSEKQLECETLIKKKTY